jgi:hypothetical protein
MWLLDNNVPKVLAAILRFLSNVQRRASVAHIRIINELARRGWNVRRFYRR